MCDLRKIDVAAYLRGQSSRGSSVPSRLYHSLVWFEKVFGFDLHSQSSLVQAQSSPASVVAPAPPKSAKMVVAKMVADMEPFTSTAPSLTHRVYSGAFCCLAHGVLRWADMLWSKDIFLTVDALIGVCWKMKKKRHQTPWAALRCGFTDCDWAGQWVAELEDAELPADDYVLRAVSRDGARFTPRSAVF